MDDMQIMKQIGELVGEEHELRDKLLRGEISNQREQERLRWLEESLDQCWDLLRQRRARREFGEDPDHAQPRPAAEVEDYLQ